MTHEITIANLVGEPQVVLQIIDREFVMLKVVGEQSLTTEQLADLSYACQLAKAIIEEDDDDEQDEQEGTLTFNESTFY
jgi:hypothetical protein